MKETTTMTLNKLLKRLPVLLVLAAIGFGLTGCSMHKRQTVEQRPAPSFWSSLRHDHENR